VVIHFIIKRAQTLHLYFVGLKIQTMVGAKEDFMGFQAHIYTIKKHEYLVMTCVSFKPTLMGDSHFAAWDGPLLTLEKKNHVFSALVP